MDDIKQSRSFFKKRSLREVYQIAICIFLTNPQTQRLPFHNWKVERGGSTGWKIREGGCKGVNPFKRKKRVVLFKNF